MEMQLTRLNKVPGLALLHKHAVCVGDILTKNLLFFLTPLCCARGFFPARAHSRMRAFQEGRSVALLNGGSGRPAGG